MENQKISKGLGRIALPQTQRKAGPAVIYPTPADSGFPDQLLLGVKPGRFHHRVLAAVSAIVLMIVVAAGLAVVTNQLAGRSHLAKDTALNAPSAKGALATAPASNKKSASVSSSKTSPPKSLGTSQKKITQPSKPIQQTPQQPVQQSSQP